jgi:hypothetical protein
MEYSLADLDKGDHGNVGRQLKQSNYSQGCGAQKLKNRTPHQIDQSLKDSLVVIDVTQMF